MKKRIVSEVLGTGRSQAKTSKELAAILGVNTRDVTGLVQKERREGSPICAAASWQDGCSPGYYLAATREDIDEFCGALFHRGGEVMKTRRQLLRIRDRLPAREPAVLSFTGEKGA